MRLKCILTAEVLTAQRQMLGSLNPATHCALAELKTHTQRTSSQGTTTYFVPGTYKGSTPVPKQEPTRTAPSCGIHHIT